MIRFQKGGILSFVVVILMAILLASWFSNGVNAAGDGGSSGGGGNEGCDDDATLSTCWGAEWRYYSTDSDYVVIPGKADYQNANDNYADGIAVVGCAEAGGYWRYAMVSHGYGLLTGWPGRYSPGDQVGVIGMDSNRTRDFDSVYWGGGMYYAYTSCGEDVRWCQKANEDFARVKKSYENSLKKWPHLMTTGWYKPGSNGTRGTYLNWFCAEDPYIDYFSSSKVTVSPSIVADTGIRKEQFTAETGGIYLRAGEGKRIEFIHNMYASKKKENVGWKIEKSFKMNDLDFNNMGSGSGGKADGEANIKNESGHPEAKYISEVSPQYGDRYNNVKFKLAAKYKLCESISVNDNRDFLTKACANVVVPYNFINTSTVKLKGKKISSGEDVAFAGEQFTVEEVKVNVGKKENGVVGANYATQVDKAKVGLVFYTTNNPAGSSKTGFGSRDTDLCSAIDNKRNCFYKRDEEENRILNKDAKNEGVTETIEELMTTYNNFDDLAGEYLCVVSAVYPYTSGSDMNASSDWNGSWYVSEPSCLKMAKKPSFQVLGGNLYSAGNVKTSVAEKSVVSGVYDYNPNSKDNTTVFGSFVELGISAPNGAVIGLASGASTGYYHEGHERSRNGLGGSWEGGSVDFCLRSPLTFPNAGCSTNQQAGTEVSGFGEILGYNRPDDRSQIVAKLTSFEEISLGAEGIIIGKNQVKTVLSEGNVLINNNIIYEDGYGSIEEIPKLFIYGKNIMIKCNVERIDAVLIAEESVNTCIDDSGVTPDSNSGLRSNQLRVRGIIISNTLDFNRTYGAAVGVNSIVPAEVVNYDTSLYLWGAPRNDIKRTGKIQTTYIKELPPRY